MSSIDTNSGRVRLVAQWLEDWGKTQTENKMFDGFESSQHAAFRQVKRWLKRLIKGGRRWRRMKAE